MALLAARRCRLLGAAASGIRLVSSVRRQPFPLRATSVPACRAASTLGNHTPTNAHTPAPPNRTPATPATPAAWLTSQPKDSDIGAVNSAILVPASVAAATPAHFVDQIDAIRPDALPSHNLAVFLATPSLATWLLDDSVFLTKALAKLYRHLPASSRVEAVCAVVDRLPHPTHTRRPEGPGAVAAALEDHHTRPLVNDTGVEGIAYVTLPREAILATPPPADGLQGSIDFVTDRFSGKKHSSYDRVRVPLANTVFQTGTPTTMIASTWAPASGGTLEPLSRTQCSTLAIHLSAHPKQSASRQHHDYGKLSIPLLPLTRPRQVHGHMGNIIRSLVDADGNSMTASTELEENVPRYFKTSGESPQATAAWALVIPKSGRKFLSKSLQAIDNDPLHQTGDPAESKPAEHMNKEGPANSLERLWRRHPPPRYNLVEIALRNGHRLHKVLSGGGGWGNKAGLLALDPMPIGAPQRKQTPKTDDADFDTVDDFSTALKPVVQDNDYIQFFISPAVAQDSASPEKPSDGIKDTWCWEFGVIPSTIDSTLPQHASEAPADMIVHRSAFGALTERGLTFMRSAELDGETGSADSHASATTIDVPFARWSAMRLVPEPGSRYPKIRRVHGPRHEQQSQQKGKARQVKSPAVQQQRKALKTLIGTSVSVCAFSTSTRPNLPFTPTPLHTRSFSSTTHRSAHAPSPKERKKHIPKGNRPLPGKRTPSIPSPFPYTEPTQSVSELVSAALTNPNLPRWKKTTIEKLARQFKLDVKRGGQEEYRVRMVKSGPAQAERARKVEEEEGKTAVEGDGMSNEHGVDTVLNAGLGRPTGSLHVNLTPDPGPKSSRPGSAWLGDGTNGRRSRKMFDSKLGSNAEGTRRFSTTRSALATPDPQPGIENKPSSPDPRAQPQRWTLSKSPKTRRTNPSPLTSRPLLTQTAAAKPRHNVPPYKTPAKHTLVSEATPSQLPRLLRQTLGLAPPRTVHERANGEPAQDFQKLEGWLWRAYGRVVRGVKRLGREVKALSGGLRAGSKKARGPKRGAKHGVVRRIAVEELKAEKGGLGDERAACAARADLLRRHTNMLASQVSSLTSASRRRPGKPTDSVVRKVANKMAPDARREARENTLTAITARVLLIQRHTHMLTTQLSSLPPTSRLPPRRRRHKRPRIRRIQHWTTPRPFASRKNNTTRHLNLTPRSPQKLSLTAAPFHPLFSPASISAQLENPSARAAILSGLHTQARRMVRRARELGAQLLDPGLLRVYLLSPGVDVDGLVVQTRRVERRVASLGREVSAVVGRTRRLGQRRGGRARDVLARRNGRLTTVRWVRRGARNTRARRVLQGGWKRIRKHVSGRRAGVRRYAFGRPAAVRRVAKRSLKQKLVDDVGSWLGGP